MFEKAAQLKLRFDFRGLCSVEDLWDLTVGDLDTIYKRLKAQSRQASEDSLLTIKTSEGEVVNLKVEIVKHVVEVKLKEYEERLSAANRRAKKQTLLEVLEHKQTEEIAALPTEEIQKLIDDLG